MCCSTPSPPHFGQAPNGLLNENSRGSISEMVKPETGQANFSENTRRSAVSLRCRLALARSPPPCGEGWGGGREAARRCRRLRLPLPTPHPPTGRSARFTAGSESGVGELGDRKPIGELERLLEQIRKPRRNIRPHHQAVDHHVDVVGEFLVERRHFGDLEKLAVDFDPLVALLHELGELLAVLAFAAAHDRREQIKPRAFRQSKNAVDHLRHGLALDRQAGRRRVGHADARPQQPHVVVDLGDGADRRARIARGGFLLDGNGRRQAVDLVDVRLLHHFQKLPRVGGKALDIAALALGINRVEGERGFARAGQPGEHHQPVARNIEIDIFEVMLARAADGDDARIARVLGRVLGRPFLVEEVVHKCCPRNGFQVSNARPSAAGSRYAGFSGAVNPPTAVRYQLERSENAGLLPGRGGRLFPQYLACALRMPGSAK